MAQRLLRSVHEGRLDRRILLAHNMRVVRLSPAGDQQFRGIDAGGVIRPRPNHESAPTVHPLRTQVESLAAYNFPPSITRNCRRRSGAVVVGAGGSIANTASNS